MTLPTTLTKGHATANDFVIYADPTGAYDPTPEEVAAICDRHRGIGGDGLIRLTRPEYVADLSVIVKNMLRGEGAEWFMDYRNADGSLAEMCGNGTRLTALFAQSLGELSTEIGTKFALATRAGVKTLVYRGNDDELGRNVFTVHMGAWKAGEIGEYDVLIPTAEGSAKGTFADLGNPHVVSVVADRTHQFAAALPASSLPDVDDLDLTRTPVVSPALPAGQNAEFVRIDTADASANAGTATMRVNERGVGETLSCGTGLCATAIVLRKITGIANWTITVRGGVLRVEVSDDDVALTGSSTLVGTVTLTK
ncbi:MAG: diaminopimelate epimerase [Bifidobacteriaceae bacterium]|nr:diaminopimelate epimerase [Bifidobacteriaceae bacterium]